VDLISGETDHLTSCNSQEAEQEPCRELHEVINLQNEGGVRRKQGSFSRVASDTAAHGHWREWWRFGWQVTVADTILQKRLTARFTIEMASLNYTQQCRAELSKVPEQRQNRRTVKEGRAVNGLQWLGMKVVCAAPDHRDAAVSVF
jgi:hypothetical protein